MMMIVIIIGIIVRGLRHNFLTEGTLLYRNPGCVMLTCEKSTTTNTVQHPTYIVLSKKLEDRKMTLDTPAYPDPCRGAVLP